MIELKIIEPSNSPFCSPVVMIAKGGGSYRLAIDFRALNSITVFDSESMLTIEHDLHKFINAKLITELDLTKAYYQIKLKENSQPLTAFATSKGRMQFT